MLKSSNKILTLAEAKKKMEGYCTYQERCHLEVERKLDTMSLTIVEKEQIILHLLKHNFLNEERFAKAFARGKFRIKKWGKQRITRELRARNITSYVVKSALQEIDELDYYNLFDDLAEKKCSSLTEKNTYKKRKKLADYLLYRGWETDLIYKKVMELIP